MEKSMERIKVLIADDHKIIRVGLRGILDKTNEVEVVAEAEDGNQVLETLKSIVTDVVLMDIDMGRTSGIETTKKVKETFPDVHVLALTMHEEQGNVIQMLEAGASGYLLKNTGVEELLAALHAVVKGDSYFSNTVSATLLKALTNIKATSKAKYDKDIPLSAREIEVLKLIAGEYTNGEIAEKLFISIRTVDTHRRNILEKLQLKNTAGLVKYAIEKAFI
jgi:DNA-binding NarL/FixJ family response regulator